MGNATGKVAVEYNWYLISAEPGMMLMMKREIVTRGVEFLLALSWRRARVGEHMQPVPEPRLPGAYAFVKLPFDPHNEEVLNEQVAQLKKLRGVREVYKNSQHKYAPVPAWEIQALRNADAEEHMEAGKRRPKFQEPKFSRGVKVRILRHGKADFVGRVVEFLYSVRGLATVDMGNGIKLTAPEVDLSQVAKADPAALAG